MYKYVPAVKIAIDLGMQAGQDLIEIKRSSRPKWVDECNILIGER